MVFTSTIFLFLFLPAAMLLFYAAPPRWRVAPLLVASAVFYAWGEPVLVVLILVTGLFTYQWGRLLVRHREDQRRTALLVVGIAVVLVPIAVFKYLDFALNVFGLDALADRTHLPLPIGVSFYTFMAIGYLIDIHRRRDDGAPGLLSFSGFLTMYPHLVAGPIVRWHDIGPQLAAPRFDPGLFGYGALRVAGGLAKKAVLADSLAVIIDGMFATGEPRSFGAAWLAVVLYSLQIYLDFSAYSDIAIGLAAMMGVRFHENFRYPYVSKSAREFWQRWHISLGSWFRDYVYIPLGGSRVRPLVLWRNLLIVWGLTGLWHGAAWTFILWGLYYGVLIGLERSFLGRAVERLPIPLQHLYGVLVAVLGWVLFRSTSVGQAGEYYRTMLTGGGLPAWDSQTTLDLQSTWVIVIVAVVLAAGIFRPLMDKAELVMAGRWEAPSGVGRRTPVPASPADPATSPAAVEPVHQGLPSAPTGGTSTVVAVEEAPALTTTAAGSEPIDVQLDELEPDEVLVREPAPLLTLALTAAGCVLLLIATAFVVATTYSPFIYFRF
ncbi:MBOAT family O-acyltransferase [Angustibacter luteus]|uniref:MBOAT family O-acyltransferase n=1 Tax=Angustibacter luteus TaxID=658456 RepID=A0ABW1JFB9_9ACTN